MGVHWADPWELRLVSLSGLLLVRLLAGELEQPMGSPMGLSSELHWEGQSVQQTGLQTGLQKVQQMVHLLGLQSGLPWGLRRALLLDSQTEMPLETLSDFGNRLGQTMPNMTGLSRTGML